MNLSPYKKNINTSSKLVTERLIRLIVCVLLLIIILLSRLAYLQIIKGNYYKTQSNNNAMGQVPLVPSRGLIYDRNNVLLAYNTTADNLDVIRNQTKGLALEIKNLPDSLEITAAKIKKFEQQLHLAPSYQPVILAPHLTEEQEADFGVDAYEFPGFEIDSTFIRQYPLKGSVASVVGYVGQMNQAELNAVNTIQYAGTTYIGKVGIEKSFETQLHGEVGTSKVQKDASGQALKTLKSTPAVPGENIYLSIDSKLQQVAEDKFNTLGKSENVNLTGAVVAIQPATGQILALYSSPGFDPNQIVSGNHIQPLLDDPNKPLYNRAIQGLYAPGSTVKPFLALGYLDNGVITPESTIDDANSYTPPGATHVFHNWDRNKSSTGGKIDVIDAITHSNDIFFFTYAYKAGIRLIYSTLNDFGFGHKTGIEINGELSGLLPDPELTKNGYLRWNGKVWPIGDTIIAGIGQGQINVTPLQLAAAVATMANRGERFKPTLIYATQRPGIDKTIVPTKPEPLPPVVLKDPNNWNIVIQGMQNVITEGTGLPHFVAGKPPGYTVAGKTGTAQVMHENAFQNEMDLPFNERSDGLFIAFAPVDKPEIAIAVVTEHDEENAPTIARAIFDQYICNELHQCQATTPVATTPASPVNTQGSEANKNPQGNNNASPTTTN